MRQHPRAILDPTPLHQPREHLEPLRADGGKQRSGIHHATRSDGLFNQPERLIVFDRRGQRTVFITCAAVPCGSSGIGMVVEEEGRDERIASSPAAGLHETGGVVRESIEARDAWVVLIQELECWEVRVRKRGGEDERVGDLRVWVSCQQEGEGGCLGVFDGLMDHGRGGWRARNGDGDDLAVVREPLGFDGWVAGANADLVEEVFESEEVARCAGLEDGSLAAVAGGGGISVLW